MFKKEKKKEKKLVFCHKAQTFVHFGPYDLIQISTACGLNTYQKNVWTDFWLTVSAFATVARKSFNGQFAQNWFSDRTSHLYYHYLHWHWKHLSLSKHYLISIWPSCWWNSNEIVWYEAKNRFLPQIWNRTKFLHFFLFFCWNCIVIVCMVLK